VCIALVMMSPDLGADVYQAVLLGDHDDGMEHNDTIWMENGYPGDEPKNYVGRNLTEFYDAGLRFHLPDLNQGDAFVWAQLRLETAASFVNSKVKLVIRGVDEASAGGFDQDNRPSQKEFLTEAYKKWEFDEWYVSAYPVYIYSTDIAPVINEILARPDWGTGPEGKTVALLIDNNDPDITDVNYVAFEDFFGGEGNAPALFLYDTVVDTFIGGPVLSRPTSDSISVSLISRMATDLYVEYGPSPGVYTHAVGESQTVLPAIDPVINLKTQVSKTFEITGLSPATRYYYRLRARKNGSSGAYEAGPEYSFITRRPPGESFDFVMLSDSHVGLNRNVYDEDWELGGRTIAMASSMNPDFFVIGGDEAGTSEFGHNSDSQYDAYLRYSIFRTLYGPLGNTASQFLVLGNHDGEASYHDADLQAYSYEARSKYTLNPDDTTYAFGGGSKENYFAWEWGDALFVCLDAFSYTGPEDPDDIEPYGSAWHLGEDQLNWLETVLSTSQARWKFLFAHHILASWEKNGYGRGGAKYAHDWEQGIIHQMMLEHGAQIFFYGHDHVFADGTADGIHYTLCSQFFVNKLPMWCTPGNPAYVAFQTAYPYGWYPDKGFISARVGPRSVWVDFVKTSNDDEQNGKTIYSYHLADVTVKLNPLKKEENPSSSMLKSAPSGSDAPSIDPATGAGGKRLGWEAITFSATFENHTREIQSYDYWVRLQIPGEPEHVYEIKEDQMLGPGKAPSIGETGLGGSRTVIYNIPLPFFVCSGTYTATVEVGDYPDHVISRDFLDCEVRR
jgi:hypothetical protein